MGQPNGWIESYISKVPGCAKAAERYPIACGGWNVGDWRQGSRRDRTSASGRNVM